MKRIHIVGLGPGGADYLLPAARRVIEKSDAVVGGKRHLAALDLSGKETLELTGDLAAVVDYLKKNSGKKVISVLASGDPGFYGILGYLKKHFTGDELDCVPGISSLQYLFARIGMTWEDAFQGSLHGRDADVVGTVRDHRKAGFLTDDSTGYREIARLLCENGLGERMMYVGSNLSYEDEEILRGRAKDLAGAEKKFNLCVVVIADE